MKKDNRTKNLEHLYAERKENVSHDKLIIEDLKKRLHDQLKNNPQECRKAALIIEAWIKKPSK